MVVESTATNTASSTDTVTITKPTGLAVGDLLAVSLFAHSNGVTITGSFNTPPGWTAGESTSFSPLKANMAVFYKVADSADVSASDFDFVHSTSVDTIGGTVIRASGQQATPVGASDEEVDTGASDASFDGAISSHTPPTDGALVIMQVGGFIAAQVNRSVSGYTVPNTTFTEAFDNAGSSIGAGVVCASAYGIQSTAAAITTYTATYSGSMTDHLGTLTVFSPRDDASGTNTLVSTTSEAFAQSGTCDTNGSNVLAEATGESFTQSGQAVDPTKWTTTPKS